MNVIELQRLASIIGTSNGYLSVNKDNQLEVKGSSFFGRIVHWVRFKFNRDYQEATLVAKRKVMASLLSNDRYGEDFQEKINDPQSKFFNERKPLSARKVSLFINEVIDEKTRKIGRAMDWVNWFSGKGGQTESIKYFTGRCKNMIAEKIKSVRGLEMEHVYTRGLYSELNAAAYSDTSAFGTIKNEQQAQAHVDNALSVLLDRRITEAHLKLQDHLTEQLEATGLDDTTEQTMAVEIADGTIATMSELAAAVNKIMIKQIGDEFDGLFEQARENLDFSQTLRQLPEVKEQLQVQLAKQNRQQPLSMKAARKQAVQLLSEWMQSKQEALAAIQPTANTLLKRLILQDPYIAKAQIESIQQSIDHAIEEVYAKDRDAYEALGINKGTFLSKLHQQNRRDVLFNKLNNLLKRAAKPDSLFDDSNWQVADVETTVQDYIKTTSESIIESYKQVSALKGKIPERIYQTLVEQINRGCVWDADFIAIANELHIDNLTADNNQGFYKLLQSPQVAAQAIGSKEDLEEFTLNELLEKMLGSKDIKNADRRRQIIDAVIPERIRTTLLDELERQLGMVKGKVMSEGEAEGLFQRGMVQLLREQRISFEGMQITADSESNHPPPIYESPL